MIPAYGFDTAYTAAGRIHQPDHFCLSYHLLDLQGDENRSGWLLHHLLDLSIRFPFLIMSFFCHMFLLYLLSAHMYLERTTLPLEIAMSVEDTLLDHWNTFAFELHGSFVLC
jgi:hypothetical protein